MLNLLQKKLRYDRFGVGVMVFNDRAGDGGLSNLTAMVGTAYHKVLDEASRYSLALGVQVGVKQRRIDFSKLRYSGLQFPVSTPAPGEIRPVSPGELPPVWYPAGY